MKFEVPSFPGPRSFTNSEAAFQASKFWRDHVDEFSPCDGEQAFQLKKKLQGKEDRSYGGFGNRWLAMQAVLRAKFQPGTPLATALLNTGDAWLLEHNPKRGRDKVWSDNCVGDGTNWLGLQLMLLRDELRGGVGIDHRRETWTEFIANSLDITSGRPWHSPDNACAVAVLNARDALVQRLESTTSTT
mmetsp:Transcript_26969/g.64033  ORF Transcript_26969/g.64033 Transcript_26969/m.64033 type:complete len:188 (+) Transcript_26969:54-617(+)